ncbi:MAG: ABC transporter permease [Candidatus Liptonbacteria bacterium]|nr:ABC transporter permease [Candidatus Liptonbacteria bacterium]
MFTIVFRIVQFGFKGFRRNGWLSTATVAITILALMVFVGLILFRVTTQHAVVSIQDKIDISVYFKNNTSEDQILNIKQSLENLSEVKDVNYVSSDKALELFKTAHKNEQVISQAVNELNTNPFQASLSIKAQKPEQYATIARYLSAPNLSNYIDNVSYAKNQVVIDRLARIIDNVNKAGFTLTLLLSLIAGLVVFNTIRLAIYSNREEIGIMRVVGASNALVRGPYMVEGIISGAIAAVASLIFIAPAIYFASPYLAVFIPGLNLFQYFIANFITLLGYQLLFGIGIGALSSFIAVRRYLKS